MDKRLPYKLLFAAALASAVLPSYKVFAADPLQVKAVREYVIKNGEAEDIKGGKSHFLVLDGAQVNYERPEFDNNPGYASKIGLQTATSPNPNSKEILFVTIRDSYKETANGEEYNLGIDTIMRDGGNNYDGNLDGRVDEARMERSLHHPKGLVEKIKGDYNLKREATRTELQNLYDKIIAGTHKFIEKK